MEHALSVLQLTCASVGAGNRNDADIEGWDAGGNVHVEQQRSAERFLNYVRTVVRGEAVAEDYSVSNMPPMVKAESLHPIATASFTATSYMLTYNSGLGTRWNVFPSAVSWNRGNSETGPLGNGAAEIRNWVAAHGAAGKRGFELIGYCNCPEVYVGCGFASWDLAARA